METKNRLAAVVVVMVMALMSCGGGGQQAKDGEPADSLVNDSVPPSGENEYQSDLEPQTQLDSIPDSTDRKP